MPSAGEVGRVGNLPTGDFCGRHVWLGVAQGSGGALGDAMVRGGLGQVEIFPYFVRIYVYTLVYIYIYIQSMESMYVCIYIYIHGIVAINILCINYMIVTHAYIYIHTVFIYT